MKKSSKTPPRRRSDHLSPPSPPPSDLPGPPSPSPNSNSNANANARLPYNSPARPQVALQQPSNKKTTPSKSSKILCRFKSVFRSFPIITPAACKFPVHLHLPDHGHIRGGTRMTGTLYGHKKSRINLALQEKPKCLPMLVLELSTTTSKLLQDVGSGLVRIALECEKNPSPSEKKRLVDEPLWTMYCNGRKMGYGVRREATEHDLSVMQMLHAVSMGAGVLPADDDASEGELTYMRAYFERVVGSRDSETYYMINPDGNTVVVALAKDDGSGEAKQME
ncbi:hypothetical protein LguiB_001868 [Lonicera macranthoides]